MSYEKHPSLILNRLFGEKPYQGVAPEQATFLFIGLDANYDPAIEQSPIFPRVREYHEDGAAFWRRYKVHHPFVLDEYSGGGKPYHRSFARIGFGPEHAAMVSFAELLHVPTSGRNKLAASDLDSWHLKRLNSTVIEGAARHIFISPSVAKLMHETGAFRWLPASRGASTPLQSLWKSGNKTVYSHLHFSNYGRFRKQMDLEAAAIQSLLL